MTIQESFNKKQKFVRKDPRAKAIDDLIIQFIVTGDQPFSVVQDIGFQMLMQHLEPRYDIPSRRYFSDTSLPALYEMLATHVHTLLAKNDANWISFTTDIWTSGVSPVSMLSMTAQWLDGDFNLQKATLHSQELPGSHTSQAICEAFEKMFQKWSITKDKVHVVLRDNARNMIKAMELCGVCSLGCMAHTLQLAIHEAVLSQKSVSDCIAIGRKMVGHFKHSQVATTALANLQTQLGLCPARLQQDVPTRWNSTFYMLQSLIQQKRPLAAYGVDNKLPATLSPHQWSLIENMVTILEPCEQLTRDISKATATAADVIPAIQALKRLLEKAVPTDHGVKTSKSTLLDAIKTRFDRIDAEPLYLFATILDPRYKDRYFTAETKEKVKKMLLEKLKNQLQCDSPDESVPVPEGERTMARGNNSLLDMYDEIIQENTEGAGRQEKMHVEVQFQTYISEATLPMKTQTLTPLDFWAKNKSRFPDLAQLARKYLSAPCTSVDSERLFSAAANVMDEKRNRLGCEKAEMILFVKKNLPLIRPELA
ncbi:unnamed protein product [Knipowitschia caucasica]